ncbi:hypothetical protein AKO1_005097 [Acrasis kona]|uniref:Uncharacterized protein n=1 Tax=Acrasis kona TaxID=1008807 RepID=A0AAW2Z5A8_9EUKA
MSDLQHSLKQNQQQSVYDQTPSSGLESHTPKFGASHTVLSKEALNKAITDDKSVANEWIHKE